MQVHEAKNCVCHFITDASDWAEELELKPKDERGPLFGLPISVKECFHVKGYDHTLGMIKFMDCPAEEDAPFVTHLKLLGAVPFCLTNVPQTLKSYGCSNPVYGETKHPMDDSRTPCGSTGGEGCLIGSRGSILGIGTDVGGSLRAPSHCCGVVGFKPTSGRIYGKGRKQAAVVGCVSNSSVQFCTGL